MKSHTDASARDGGNATASKVVAGGPAKAEAPKIKGKREQPPKPDYHVACPRCKSNETKFCYYNNYNIKQPRFYCRDCCRYWTEGGMLRNVRVGSGRRKTKKTKEKRLPRPLRRKRRRKTVMLIKLTPRMRTVSVRELTRRIRSRVAGRKWRARRTSATEVRMGAPLRPNRVMEETLDTDDGAQILPDGIRMARTQVLTRLSAVARQPTKEAPKAPNNRPHLSAGAWIQRSLAT